MLSLDGAVAAGHSYANANARFWRREGVNIREYTARIHMEVDLKLEGTEEEAFGVTGPQGSLVCRLRSKACEARDSETQVLPGTAPSFQLFFFTLRFHVAILFFSTQARCHSILQASEMAFRPAPAWDDAKSCAALIWLAIASRTSSLGRNRRP